MRFVASDQYAACAVTINPAIGPSRNSVGALLYLLSASGTLSLARRYVTLSRHVSAVLILLPPSEGKTPARRGRPLDLGDLGYSHVLVRHLADDQQEVLASYERLAAVRSELGQG